MGYQRPSLEFENFVGRKLAHEVTIWGSSALRYARAHEVDEGRMGDSEFWPFIDSGSVAMEKGRTPDLMRKMVPTRAQGLVLTSAWQHDSSAPKIL